MSLMLRRGIEVLVGAALVIVMLAVLPGVAQAQSGAAGAAPTRVEVKPGDSLWTISEEHLGPRATPRQIAGMLERIYALNRDRIGPDPNLIFSGQELSLPAPAGGSSAAPAGTAAQGAAKSEHLVKENTKQKGGAADQRDQQVLLPKLPASTAVPAVGAMATDAPLTAPSAVASFAENMRSAVTSAAKSASGALAGTFAEARVASDGRQLLGWGIIALTLIVGALMAWKLPMKRGVGESEKWGIYPHYPGVYPPDYSRGYAETKKRRSPVAGLGVIAQKRKQLTTRRRSKRPPRRWSAAEAHSVDVRRFSRRAVLRTRPRKPRDTRLKTARRSAVQRIARGGR